MFIGKIGSRATIPLARKTLRNGSGVVFVIDDLHSTPAEYLKAAAYLERRPAPRTLRELAEQDLSDDFQSPRSQHVASAVPATAFVPGTDR